MSNPVQPDPHRPRERRMTTDPLHTVTAEWGQYGAAYRFHCAAPPESLCHAVYDCHCEGWIDAGIESGRPWHTIAEYDEDATDGDRDVRHLGVLKPDECGLRDWFENTDDPLHGAVTFPVRAEWEGDYYTFHPQQGGAA